MAINLTFMATEAPVVVYLADGSSKSFPPQEQAQFQLPSGSFCTISSTAGSEETDEHMSPEDRAKAFAEKMIAFWQGVIDKYSPVPEATPY